jgi:hypothetical protein
MFAWRQRLREAATSTFSLAEAGTDATASRSSLVQMECYKYLYFFIKELFEFPFLRVLFLKEKSI